MQVLNRWVMIVKPKQPFMDWVCSHGEFNPTEDEICSDPTAYLVPSYFLISEQALIIEECYDLIFEEELFSWYTDETMWPEQRDLKTFLEWFDVEFHTLVFDLAPDHPLYEIDSDPHNETGPDEDNIQSNGH